MVELVGRGAEVGRIEQALDAVETVPQAVLILGPPGIGKTALWRFGIERAREQGTRCLLARPAEAEASLAFSGLGDLLDGAIDVLGRRPGPQRRALRVALLLEEAGDEPVNARALSVALLGLLRELACDGPILVGVDDLQWLDPPSAGALRFALRRIEKEPVAFLAAARPSVNFDFERLTRLTLGPLGLTELDHVVRRVGMRFPRPVLRRLETVSGGNPFYALELARALARRTEPLLALDALPLPETLTEAVRERIVALPVDAREALVVASALSSPARDLVTAAVGTPDAVAAAVDAHVLALNGDRVRLEHPLLGSVAYALEPPARRRDLHRRLAGLVAGEEERARHLANAADGPDEAVAVVLEAAARNARARGASEVAAELAELAVELTPASEPQAGVQRRALAGDCHFAAGDAHRGEALLEDVAARTPAGVARARVLWRLATVKAAVSGPPSAYPLYLQALEEGRDDLLLCARIHDRLVTWLWIGEGAAAARPHAHALVELAEGSGEAAVLARAIGTVLALDVCQGRPLDDERHEQMLALEREAPDDGAELPGSTLHHQLLTWAGRYEESRMRITHFLQRARERSEASQILPLWCLGYVDALSAEWERSLESVARGLELVEHAGRGALLPPYMSLRAIARAHLGEVDGAVTDGELAISLCERSGQEIHVLVTRAALGVLDLSQGDTRGAHSKFADVAVAVERRGESGLGQWWLPDEIEARVAEGDVDEAVRRLTPFREASVTAGLPRFEAASARCAAVVAFARGDQSGALDEFDAAIAHHERVEDDYQLGRTLLALGSVQRRLLRRAAAAETLDGAVKRFESVGAALWARRAGEERGRIGGRPAATSGLTATELKIAQLVRAGRSNADVARALSISPKTVEWNLSKIYRKLHVGSRTELAAKLVPERR
ncbi:MAG: AAA family ATPase [Gaiellaceae bacterium]